MRKGNIGIFGLIFISFFAYMAWNNFEIPVLFLGKTKVTNGRIYKIGITNGLVGRRYIQVVRYAYSVNGKDYQGIKKINRRYSSQRIGNRIQIEYSFNHPEKHKVTGFYSNFKRYTKGEKFHSNETKGYSEITLTNGIFDQIRYGDHGTIAKEIFGEYEMKNDSLKLSPFQFSGDEKNSCFIVAPSERGIKLIDCESNLELTQ